MVENKYNKLHENDVEWSVRSSDVNFTNKKVDVANIGLSPVFILSPQNKNLITGFYLEDGTWLRSLDGGGGIWGRGSTPMGGNPFKQALPERLKLTYYSYLEDQFYQLDTALPKQKINDLFRVVHKGMGDEEGYLGPNIYDAFDIALALQGWVILFAVGNSGRQEIAAWQANKIEADYDVDIASRDGGDIKWIREQELRKKAINDTLNELKTSAPVLYENYKQGKGLPSADWYKKMQTKYPWNLEVIAENGEWSGEYETEYANTERFPILTDQADADKSRLKAVPVKILTWVTYKPTGVRYAIEVHLFPIPKWSANRYIPYYQDPNLSYFFKRFEHLYPGRSLATNDQVLPADVFSTLKMEFDDDFKLKDIYLQKGGERLPIEGAYEYYLAPVDKKRGNYFYEQGFPRFITEPGLKDLTDPLFADRD